MWEGSRALYGIWKSFRCLHHEASSLLHFSQSPLRSTPFVFYCLFALFLLPLLDTPVDLVPALWTFCVYSCNVLLCIFTFKINRLKNLPSPTSRTRQPPFPIVVLFMPSHLHSPPPLPIALQVFPAHSSPSLLVCFELFECYILSLLRPPSCSLSISLYHYRLPFYHPLSHYFLTSAGRCLYYHHLVYHLLYHIQPYQNGQFCCWSAILFPTLLLDQQQLGLETHQ